MQSPVEETDLPLLTAHPRLCDALPRRALVQVPTAVERMPLDGAPDGCLYVKRDDASCASYGGNKPRKLEFVLGRALSLGARRLVTTGALGSHHGLATTILGREAGLPTTLVLVAVFVPVAFLGGTTGVLYQQFAITIAISVSISSFVALTLTPALSALLLAPRSEPGGLFKLFNRTLDAVTVAYTAGVKVVIRLMLISLIGIGAMLFGIKVPDTERPALEQAPDALRAALRAGPRRHADPERLAARPRDHARPSVACRAAQATARGAPQLAKAGTGRRPKRLAVSTSAKICDWHHLWTARSRAQAGIAPPGSTQE